MTPQARATLDDILDNFKNGNRDRETTAQMIQDLFKREPFNYQRTMNPEDNKHR